MTRSPYAIVIVGAGPGGCAAALRIAARPPGLGKRTFILDRREPPHDKLCGGGVAPPVDAQLARVHAAPAVASCPVAATELVVGARRELLRATSACALGTGIPAADTVVAAIHRGYRRDPADRYFQAARLFGRSSA